jgi:Biotin-protein ligase, N terminal
VLWSGRAKKNNLHRFMVAKTTPARDSIFKFPFLYFRLTATGMVWATLLWWGKIPPAVGAENNQPPRAAAPANAHADAPLPVKIKIALYKGPGTGGNGPPDLIKKFNEPNARTSLVEITPDEIRAGALTNFDVVIFAGGSGSQEAKAIGEDGRAQVEKFVACGGGYVGICAGAYLATAGYPWSLKIINAHTLSPKWQRGKAVLKLEVTPEGQKILGGSTNVDCLYHQGPIVGPFNSTNLPPYQVLAWFRSEVASNGTPQGIQINSPAIFAGTYQNGRVVCVSPHPEQTAGLEYIVPQAVNWVVGTDRP